MHSDGVHHRTIWHEQVVDGSPTKPVFLTTTTATTATTMLTHGNLRRRGVLIFKCNVYIAYGILLRRTVQVQRLRHLRYSHTPWGLYIPVYFIVTASSGRDDNELLQTSTPRHSLYDVAT